MEIGYYSHLNTLMDTAVQTMDMDANMMIGFINALSGSPIQVPWRMLTQYVSGMNSDTLTMAFGII